MQYSLVLELWEYGGKSSWYFVTLPKDISGEIKENFSTGSRGFGSVRVEVAVSDVNWKTSIFPDTERGAYLLPIKKEVRTRLGVVAGDSITLDLNIVL